MCLSVQHPSVVSDAPNTSNRTKRIRDERGVAKLMITRQLSSQSTTTKHWPLPERRMPKKLLRA